jgi:NAD(P)-dependent dehydrogenase (short-subunit alcohol dehydrogenase family)
MSGAIPHPDPASRAASDRPAARPVAIVTGGTRGIGLATALAFARRGFDLVIGGRDEASLASAASELSRLTAVATVRGDTTDAATRKSLVDTALARFHRVDVLVNNAGHFVPRRFEEYDAATFSRLVTVHLEATFFLSQLVAPAMRAQGSGAIVNVTTTLAERAVPGVYASAQAAVKGAVNALTRSLANELGEHGIRVNAVAPGTIRTAIAGLDESELAVFGERAPLRRIGEPAEIADAIVHLATSRFTTGVVLAVDGGVLT